MTAEGMQKLKDELNHMRSVERPAISAAIAEARDKGDLSENAEYDAAKEAQGMLEMKINQLNLTISEARIIDTSKLKTDTVQVLTKVELKNVKTGMKMCYAIVPESAINYTLRVWTPADEYWNTLFTINENIKAEFDKAGVEMTYPHLNVHLNS